MTDLDSVVEGALNAGTETLTAGHTLLTGIIGDEQIKEWAGDNTVKVLEAAKFCELLEAGEALAKRLDQLVGHLPDGFDATIDEGLISAWRSLLASLAGEDATAGSSTRHTSQPPR